MAHQNPDDLTCRPAAFSRILPSGTVEKTFFVYNPWHLNTTKKIGELVVLEDRLGTLISIQMEPE